MIPENFKITIKGKLVDDLDNPLPEITLIICTISPEELKKNKFTLSWATGADGKPANPHSKTTKTGNFTIEADKRFCLKTGVFVLKGNFLPGTTMHDGVICGPGNQPLVIVVDSVTKNINLGTVQVKTTRK